jgi:ketosteroid isomerase-like protein
LTQGNVEIVRRAYAAFSAGNIQELMDLAAPQFVLRASPATDGSEHHGPKAMREIADVIRERWLDFRFEPLEFYDAGNAVLVLGTLIAKGRDEKRFASTAGQLWTLEDGKFVLMRAFLDSKEAIQASGLTRLLT